MSSTESNSTQSTGVPHADIVYLRQFMGGYSILFNAFYMQKYAVSNCCIIV
jgi:hypothetical protein